MLPYRLAVFGATQQRGTHFDLTSYSLVPLQLQCPYNLANPIAYCMGTYASLDP